VPDRSTPVGYDVRPGKRPRELPESRRPDLHVRAGILITGTEVLSGIISDRNGRGCRSACASTGSTPPRS
jgi:hypothetical protein